ncbi:MAG: alpha/beta hydrolase [Chthoniobacteraceae bacterium]
MKLIAILTALACIAHADAGVVRDIEFARVAEHSLKLDLHLPPADVPAKQPLIVYVHGGAWRAGSRSDMPLGKLVARGFAVASVDYRLSTAAPFPAQAHDIKAAIRFLRARAADFKIDATRIAIAGSSAGGHLAAVVGVTNGVKELEGSVGITSASSDVQAIIGLYGASNLETILGQSTPHGLSVRVPALQLLLGGQPAEKPQLARLASPVAHIDANDPPLLLIHGDADPQMPFEQSLELQRAYEAANRPVQLEVVRGGKHGGPEFYDDARTALMAHFLAASASR